MNLDINLAPQVEKKKALPRVLFLSIIVFVLVVAIVFGSLMYLFFLKSQASTMESERAQLSGQISRELARQDNYVVFVNKLSSIDRLLAQRIPLDVRLSTLLDKIPSGIEVSMIDMEPDSIRLLLVGRDLASMSNFLKTGLEELSASDKEIVKVDVVSFERDGQSDNYTASVLITYK